MGREERALLLHKLERDLTEAEVARELYSKNGAKSSAMKSWSLRSSIGFRVTARNRHLRNTSHA